MGISFNGRTLPASGLIAAWDMRFPPYINTGNIGSNRQSTEWFSSDRSAISVVPTGDAYHITATSGRGNSLLKMYGWESEGAVIPSYLSFEAKTNTVPAKIGNKVTTDEWQTFKFFMANIDSVQISALSEDTGFDILATEPVYTLDDPIKGYMNPSKISQEIYDLSGHGNTLIKGISSLPDTNSPTNSITGQLYDSDDVCKSDIVLPDTCTIGIAFSTDNVTDVQHLLYCVNEGIYLKLKIEAGTLWAFSTNTVCSLPITTGNHVAVITKIGPYVTLAMDSFVHASSIELLGFFDTPVGYPLYIGNSSQLDSPILGRVSAVAVYEGLVADTGRLIDSLTASLEYTPFKVY